MRHITLGEAADAWPASQYLTSLKGGPMLVPRNGLSTPPTQPAVRSLLIVARDQGDLYDCLQHAYSDSETITVLLDRRGGSADGASSPWQGSAGALSDAACSPSRTISAFSSTCWSAHTPGGRTTDGALLGQCEEPRASGGASATRRKEVASCLPR